MWWGDFLGSRTSSIYFRLLRDCSLTFLKPPVRSLLRARLQFPICGYFTSRLCAGACFLSHGCSSRDLQCPRAPRSQWLLSQPGLVSSPVSVVSVTAQHPACFTFLFLKHLTTRQGCCCTYTAKAVSAISCHSHSTRSL